MCAQNYSPYPSTMSLSVLDPTPLSSQPAISTFQTSTARYVARIPSILKVFHSALLIRASQDALVQLKSLANIIQSSVEQIEAVSTANSFDFPSPESIFSPESEAPRMHPAIQSAGQLITSAAAQLMTLVRPAPLTLLDTVLQVRLNASQTMDNHSQRWNIEVPSFYCHTYCGQHACC
jgi:hypothetical protein